MTQPRPEPPAVQVLVDAMLARAHAEHPQVEFTIIMTLEQSLLLPIDADQLWRTVNGQLAYYRCHVYRDHEVVTMPLTQDDQVLLCPLLTFGEVTPASRAPTYSGTLTTATISTLDPT